MPELPEVETFRCILTKYIIGKIITNCKIFCNKIVKYPFDSNEFIKKIIKQKINRIDRMGKYLLFILDNYVLISHLRMEGKYYFFSKYNCKDIEIKKYYIAVLFELNYKFYLFYCDKRKFGTMHLYNKNNYLKKLPLSNLGYEPFDKKITILYLKNFWKNKLCAIKSILLEQNVIAGIGNIYANEILFASKIHPSEKIKKFVDKDYQNIINKTKIILQKAIDMGGTTILNFQSELGINGNFFKELKIYGRNKMKCFDCNKLINKIFINKRGTYFCDYCQKLR